jgi:TonB-linked SusC/RagA family outer membrane protein
MEKLLSPRRLFASGLVLLFAVMFSSTAYGQQVNVTGAVTNAGGAPLRGVTVRVEGTEVRTLTDANGRYSVAVPATGVLTFSLLGQRLVQTRVEGRSTIDVQMEPIAFLEEVVVTAYTEQRRADITGAVASVNMDATSRQTSASVLQRLDANVTGVTVANSGSPGSRSTVRIRGISSFQNNDPLYIVDGTPVTDSYVNFLNPNDITSIQVLKDASAASIYGSRASNGVIVITTTKRGVSGPPRTTLSVRTGMSSPVRGYDDFLILNALDYHAVLKAAHLNAGDTVPTIIYGDPNNPSIPIYTYVDEDLNPTLDQWMRPIGVNEGLYSFPNFLIMPGSPGTNWWKSVWGTGFVGDYNLSVSGGGDDNVYGVSFNFFNQKGTAAYNHFRRGSARVNTEFNRGRLSFGENIALSVERFNGGLPNDDGGEDGILGKDILLQPVIPVYDIQGNFASGKTTSLGNQSNPLKFAFARRDNQNKNDRVFGNIFGALAIDDALSVRSRLGFNIGQGAFQGFTPPRPENSEAIFTNSITENNNSFMDWTWSNTATYNRVVLERHNVALLVGQEATAGRNRFITAGISNLISTDPAARYVDDALGDAGSKVVRSEGGRSALLSFFGKADYNFDEKYILSLTLRKDGSSRMGPSHRWATFPAVGLGWRLSKEGFMAGNRLFSDVMLRAGWGVTGNQAIPGGRTVSQFGGARQDTYYDVGGTNTQVIAGFRQTSLGNPDLKWEENVSTNVGADVGLLDGRVNVVLDLYRRETDNLLFDPRPPGTSGVASAQIQNVGEMRNTGVDFSVGYRVPAWSVTFNASTYSNKIVRIDGVQDFFIGPLATRFGNQVINKVGHPIGAFFGYETNGYFQTQAEADAATKDANGVCPSTFCQDGADPGRIKFRDTNGDGDVTLADRTIIGSPHPDFTAGLDFTARRGPWDLSATFFGSFGNDIFDTQKEYYIFRNFSTNVRRDLLANSWTPSNPNAKYPEIDLSDQYSSALSDFYVEDGSYVRLRNVQLGYDVPPRLLRWIPAAKLFVQAENLFTITGYEGLDPALPAANVTRAAGDVRDQYRGIDRGSYPSNRTFSIGMITTF